ncbi:MAG: Do family serine endopeptidase [Bacteroidaceae bacterium]|jgi:Do/DeqQ family serine protease
MKETTKVLAGLAVAAIIGAGMSGMIAGNKGTSVAGIAPKSNQLVQIAPQAAAPAVTNGGMVDFTSAAEASVHAVVHIRATINPKKTTIQMRDPFSDFFGDFFGMPSQPQERQIETPKREGIGSGVILSSDGYIVTNNHVVDQSDELTVTLNDKREFKARLIGQDAATDLALIKIDAKDLPTLPVGDSDKLKVGEWVLAVGNPLNLSSTVTAGIVSAKARNIGMGGAGIESFIQTDAAINQGNSGGALVNTRGELVGINAAIISSTGSYSGYGFAIPTSIMQKVVNDLKEYGIVQRAVLGIMGGDNSDELSKKEDLGIVDGVYVSEVTEGGAAEEAGLQKNDVITAINDKKIHSMGELQETIAQLTPGTKVKVTYYREKKEHTVNLTLKNSQGNTQIVKNVGMEILGAAFREVSDETKKRLNIRYGIEVTGVKDGPMKDAGVEKGFIILRVNDQVIKSVDDMESVFKAATQDPDQTLFIIAMNSVGKRIPLAVDLSQETNK